VTAANRPASARGSRGAAAFVLGVGLGTAGSFVSLLSATGITTAAGHLDSGAIYTGLYIVIGLVAGALTMPYAPHLCRVLGTRLAFAWATSLLSGFWILVALLIFLGVPPLPVLLLAAPVAGGLIGFTAVVSPVVYKAYLSSTDMTQVMARMTVVKGVAAAVGALASGVLISSGTEAFGLLVAGLLRIPLALFALRIAPALRIADPLQTPTPWGDIVTSLKESPGLRRATFLACGVAVFVAPLLSLVVPLTQALRREPLLQGAGLLMASISIGELLSPIVVSRFRAKRTPIASSALASVATGGILLALAVASMTLSNEIELVVWGILGVGFGANRFASRALTFGAAAEAQAVHDVSKSLAAMLLSACLVAPVGIVAWSTILRWGSAPAALVFGAVGIGCVGIAISRPRLTA
jgi:hypothetical protein